MVNMIMVVTTKNKALEEVVFKDKGANHPWVVPLGTSHPKILRPT